MQIAAARSVAIGTSLHAAPQRDFGRKRGTTDKTGLAASVRSVENDPGCVKTRCWIDSRDKIPARFAGGLDEALC
jgi:hypothetical protein